VRVILEQGRLETCPPLSGAQPKRPRRQPTKTAVAGSFHRVLPAEIFTQPTLVELTARLRKGES
jgi:hypothetical protein